VRRGLLNVLAVTPLYPPRSRVGAWLTTHEFLVGLVARGHQVVVATYMSNKSYTIDGVRVVATAEFRQRLDESSVLVSHCGDGGRFHDLARQAGKPSVRMYHGGPLQGMDGAAAVVFNSQSAKDATTFAGRSVVCHPPTFPDRYATTPGDRVTLVNLSPAKGGRVLQRVAKVMPDVEFLGVVGHTGSQREPRVANIEVVDNTNDMREVFARTRVLLMPSQAETWGRVGIEAMCSGIPVIANPTPGLRESLGNAGVFVSRNDIPGLVAQIRRLSDPEEWAKQSALALGRVAELDPQAQVDRFAELIESL
jgi:glycosyltransferase involved in cell wall biosynthesis